jgi:tRNA modification GTPase
MTDTIVALATPPGKSGVAVLRISGDNARDAIAMLGDTTPLKPRMAHYCTLLHPEKHHVVDQALVLYFPAPHSFTGEDVVEIQCHGSRAVIRELTSILLSSSFMRYAEPGEFSRRALENGKMDMVQVEALMDLIESETPRQKELALRQLGGNISEQYQQLERLLIEARAFCEVFLDFPEDDLPDMMDTQINEKILACIHFIESLLATAKAGYQTREGIQVALIGVPNAGKSTLLNAIAGRDVAITSAIEGTTRDAIELYKDIQGVPYRFFDTAGMRETTDEIESQGVAIATRLSSNADIVLLVLDGTKPLGEQLAIVEKNVSRETICVINKTDSPNFDKTIIQNVSRETFYISARRGTGVEDLLSALALHRENIATDAIFITRERHAIHLHESLHFLTLSLNESDLVLKSEYMISACSEVGAILGKIHIEQVLDVLFSAFCIGK